MTNTNPITPSELRYLKSLDDPAVNRLIEALRERDELREAGLKFLAVWMGADREQGETAAGEFNRAIAAIQTIPAKQEGE